MTMPSPAQAALDFTIGGGMGEAIGMLGPVALACALYAAGWWRLRRRPGAQNEAAILPALVFGAGIALLVLATWGPLHDYGQWSLAAHMGQHMLLMALVPPLLLAGRPGAVIAGALPDAIARRWHGTLARLHERLAMALTPAAALQVAVMWFWHHPAAITATLYDARLHALMHVSFLLSGLWLWMALLRRIRDPQSGVVAALVVIVAMMMQMGLLGALLTFSGRLLYPVCSARAAARGLDPMGDQQLAGLIMWVPACLPYLIGGLWLLHRGFRHIGRRDGVEPGS